MNNKFKHLIALLGLVGFLGACAQKLPEELQYPKFSGTTAPVLSVGVTDKRDFIVNGDKEPWFEGIWHAAFGIPASPKRIGETEGKPFAYYLSTMIKSTFVKAGSDVTIVELPIGMSFDDAVEKLINRGQAGIVVVINKSRYAFWMTAEYAYNFDIAIINQEGGIKVKKSFGRMDEKMPLSSTYNVFDMFTEIYTKRLQEIFDDPEIKEALESLREAKAMS